MPTYDFLCENCGEIEFQHSLKVPHPTKCPICGGKMERYFGGQKEMPPVRYEGNGWTGALKRIRRTPESPESFTPYD